MLYLAELKLYMEHLHVFCCCSEFFSDFNIKIKFRRYMNKKREDEKRREIYNAFKMIVIWKNRYISNLVFVDLG